MTQPQPEGQLVAAGEGRWELRFARHYPQPPETVWRALTEPEHLAHWFPFAIDGERTAGAELHFRPHGAHEAMFEGRLLTWDPPREFAFSWGEGETLQFVLSPAGSGTRLEFVNTITQLGKAARDSASWHVCLEALDRDLAGQLSTPETGDRWAALHPSYVARFGPEASTIGRPAG